MKQKKYTKRALCMSLLSMLLCCSMLIGTTFAWFTDSVTSGRNRIVAGNLDVELYHTSASVKDEAKVDGLTNLFVDADGNPIKWEPGVIAYENFTVKNEGTLALKYELALNILDKNATDSAGNSLDEVIQVAFLDKHFTGDRAEAEALDYGKLSDMTKSGEIEPKTDDDTFAVVLYWKPNVVDDNLYNLKNGLTTDDGEDSLWIELGVSLMATQYTYESDSFDNQYDADAGYVYTAVSPEELGPVAKNAKKGDVIQLTGDEFDAEALNSIPDGVALQGEVDAGGNILTTVEVGRTPVNLKNNRISNVKFEKDPDKTEFSDMVSIVKIGDTTGATPFYLENCIFDYSTQPGSNFPGLEIQGPGTVKGCQFVGKSAIKQSTAVGEILIEDCKFNNNSNGYSIHFKDYRSDSHITIKDCEFPVSGQIIDISCPAVTMEGCTLDGTYVQIRSSSNWTTHDNVFKGNSYMMFEFIANDVTFTSTNDEFSSYLSRNHTATIYLFTFSAKRTGIRITIDGEAPKEGWAGPGTLAS